MAERALSAAGILAALVGALAAWACAALAAEASAAGAPVVASVRVGFALGVVLVVAGLAAFALSLARGPV